MKTLLPVSLIAFLLFLCTWLPRSYGLDTFVTADEPKWLARSANFYLALVTHDAANTFQREHPGVTVMWAGTLGLLQMVPGYAQLSPRYFDAGSTEFADWLKANTGVTPLQLLTAGRNWIVFLLALLTAWAFLPLRRLIGVVPAVVAVLFLAWMPWNVALGRLLHPEGLVASLSFLALTYFLVWLYGAKDRRDLVVSGVLMGLAWLTKTPAILLVVTGAILVAAEVWRVRQAAHHLRPKQQTTSMLGNLLQGYIVWGLIAAATFVLLWPAMWLNPIGTLSQIAGQMTKYAAGHDNGNFFLGRRVDDPGVLFYPIAFWFRSSPATLIGLVAAGVAAARRASVFHDSLVRRTVLGMVAWALVFVAAMSIPATKFDRYLLPAFLPLDVVAALGWVAIASTAAGFVRERVQGAALIRYSSGVFVLSLAFAIIVLHGAMGFMNFPYYMTYYNPLAGGSRTAAKVMFVGWGEGLDQAASWLNHQPDASQKRTLSWYVNGPFSYFYGGTPLNVSGTALTLDSTDYVVLYANQIQRMAQPQSIRYLLEQPPAHVVNVAGLELARIYDMQAILGMHTDRKRPLVAVPVSATWPGLSIHRLSTWRDVAIGDVLLVNLDISGRINGSLKLSARLVDATGAKIAQKDLPVAAHVEFPLFIPPETTPGNYTLQFVAYEPDTQAVLSDSKGNDTTNAATVQVTDAVWGTAANAADFRTDRN